MVYKDGFTHEEIIVHQIAKIDESWPYIEGGGGQFLLRKLHESRIKFREKELKEILTDAPYLNAGIVMKLPLTYGSGLALIALHEYVKKFNPSNAESFMLRIANRATDMNMRAMARVMIKQHLETMSL